MRTKRKFYATQHAATSVYEGLVLERWPTSTAWHTPAPSLPLRITAPTKRQLYHIRHLATSVYGVLVLAGWLTFDVPPQSAQPLGFGLLLLKLAVVSSALISILILYAFAWARRFRGMAFLFFASLLTAVSLRVWYDGFKVFSDPWSVVGLPIYATFLVSMVWSLYKFRHPRGMVLHKWLAKFWADDSPPT